MSETLSLDEVTDRIRSSLDELQRLTAVNEWERRQLRKRVRDHVAAFGVVELFGEMTERARAYATFDRVGPREMEWYELALEPTNPNAAPIHAVIDWNDDEVTLFPGAGGRVHLWPSRKDSAEEFIARVRSYVDAVVTGGFRATYWIKTHGNPLTVALTKGDVISSKFEFYIDGKWRRAGELLPGAPGAQKLERAYEPY